MLNIDNNPVENAIRPAALSRKNYLFAGSHEAAQLAAMIYSLFATCRMHKINPYDWLKVVLQHMHLYTTSNIHELPPQNWNKPEALNFRLIQQCEGRLGRLVTLKDCFASV